LPFSAGLSIRSGLKICHSPKIQVLPPAQPRYEPLGKTTRIEKQDC
jgi:hypothetical protein